MTRVFSSLNSQEALQIAIFIEERNAAIYQRFAEMFSEFGDPESLEISNVFWDMSVEEKRHSVLLQGKYRDHYGDAKCDLTEEDLHELIEVPKLESSDVFEAAEAVMAGPRQRALRVALDAEKSAHDFYTQLVGTTEDSNLRRLYAELSTMEDGHVSYLQGLLAVSTTAGNKGVQ
jgi:rubrerythrin